MDRKSEIRKKIEGNKNYPPEGYSACHFTLKDEVVEKLRGAISNRSFRTKVKNPNEYVEEAFIDFYNKVLKEDKYRIGKGALDGKD